MNDASDQTGEKPAFAQRLPALFSGMKRPFLQSDVDHQAVLADLHTAATGSARFTFLTILAAGIAISGMLFSAPIVVVGAVLISPLNEPVLRLGFGLATFSWPDALKGVLNILWGILLVALTSAMMVIASPLQDITPEILAVTRPNLFYLIAATLSGLAVGYAAVSRRGAEIFGAALSIALLPPLVALGFGVSTLNIPIISGSFSLFLTNLVAISFSIAVMARIVGFDGPPEGQKPVQKLAIALLIMLLAIPLGFSLRQIIWEGWATRTVRQQLSKEFGVHSRIVSLDPDYSRQKLLVRATILTDRVRGKAVPDLEHRLARKLNRSVQLQLSQVLLHQNGGGQAELNRARTVEAEARADQLARADMAARMSLVANVPVESVLVDPVARIVSAQGSSARSLRDLWQAELRLAEESPGWTVRIMPPAGPLPGITWNGPELTEEQSAEYDALIWALERRGTNNARIIVRRVSRESVGEAAVRAESVAELLRNRGLNVEVAPIMAANGALEQEQGLSAARLIQVEPLAPIVPPQSAEEAEIVNKPVRNG